MRIKVLKIKTMLYFGIFLFTLKAGYDLSTIMPHNEYVDNIIIGAGLLCMIIAIVQQGYSMKTLLLYAAITAVSLYCTVMSGQSVIIITVITILAIRQADVSEVIKAIRVWSTAFLCIHTVYFFVLLLLDQTQLFVMDAQGRYRASFGFTHANSFSVYLFNIIIAWVWENFEKLKTRHIVVILAIEAVAFAFTDSRTAFACSVVFSVLLLIVINTHNQKKWMHWLAAYCVPVISCLFLFVFINWKSGNAFVNVLNTALTGRIKLGAYAYANYGITMLGQKLSFGAIQWTSEWNLEYFTLDCTYTSLWTNIGWIWIAIISLCFFKLAKMHDTKISVFIIVWALYAITEVHGLHCYLCFPILLISLLFSEGVKQKQELSLKGNT